MIDHLLALLALVRPSYVIALTWGCLDSNACMAQRAVEFVTHVLPWFLSCITIWMTLLAGNHHPRAWLLGLLNQALWLVWMLTTGTWGLLPLNAALWVVYGRNHLKWAREKSKP